MKKIILGFILGGIIFTLGGVVATTAISSTNVTYQNKTVNNALDELYNEAITGKELVAAAITNKGITTTSNDTYEVMASNINNIDTDHTEINQKISNLESKHNSDIASLTGSISNLNQSLAKLKFFNSPIDISNSIAQDTGYIAPCDGFLYVIMNPSTVATALIMISSSDDYNYAGAWMSLTSNTGSTTSSIAPAFQGVTYKRIYDINNKAKIYFIPKSR